MAHWKGKFDLFLFLHWKLCYYCLFGLVCYLFLLYFTLPFSTNPQKLNNNNTGTMAIMQNFNILQSSELDVVEMANGTVRNENLQSKIFIFFVKKID